MPARPSAPSRDRDYDFSNIGKVGRRTGVTLAPRDLDEHGLENMSGMFSSPKKPSPAANRRAIMESVEEVNGEESPHAGKTQTPGPSRSLRRSVRGTSHPLPRSASPRKSGITGSARRIGVRDTLAEQQLQQEVEIAEEDAPEADTQLSATPVQLLNQRAASARPATIRRFSPDETPLRNRVVNRVTKSAFVGRVSDVQPVVQQADEDEEIEQDETPSKFLTSNHTHVTGAELSGGDDLDGGDDAVNVMGEEDNDEPVPVETDIEDQEEEPDLQPLPRIDDDNEDEDETFEPETRNENRRRSQNKANSRRKRKSDAVDDIEAISSPMEKRAKRISDEGISTVQKQTKPRSQKTKETARDDKARKPLSKKSTNIRLSQQQQKELDDVVDKIRARPGHNKSLYVLRRETPADDAVTHTRSGRISIKPLAYWRNEGIVYGGSPGGILDGQRFPLNSIKEIIRTEEQLEDSKARSKSKRTRQKGKGKARLDDESDSDLDIDGEEERIDPNADDWELDTGTLKGAVSVWDPEQQAPVEEMEEVDLAHASAAIQTREVKGSSFRYAKLLSTRFFGTGVVDLPPGGVKKPKNSRKMHMSFFVAQGRVTVEVGPLNGQLTRFSIGKGSFWQVPRGNQYSIENEHGKSARIFFSQACEPTPADLEE